MTIFRDLRQAVRDLARVPVFTMAAVTSLTLGIATATTVFSLIDAAVLRPPPFPEAERLTVLYITQHTPAEGEQRQRWSWSRFQLLAGSARSFDDVGATSNAVATLTGVDDPEPVRLEIVSARYLPVLRAPFVLGGGFSDAVDDPGAAAPAVVLGHDFWMRRFAGDREVVGRVIELNGVALTVTGVTARGFAGVSGLAQAWIPAAVAPRVTYAEYLETNQNFITVIGRLRHGVTVGEARAELLALGPRIHAAVPSDADTPADRFSAGLATLNEARSDVVTRRALLLLGGAAGVLLLIACANVASLLLGRAAARRQEIALRLALGAGRARLVRQMLVEGGVLAAASGVLGLTGAVWLMAGARIPATLARGRNFYGAVGEFAEPALDWRVLSFAILACTCTALLFALVPALRATRADLAVDLGLGRRSYTGGRGLGLRELVVALQVALAVVLVAGCGLLLTSYGRLVRTPLGFDPGGLLTFMIRPSEVKYPPAAAPALLDRVLEEVARVPLVESATVDGCAPLTVQCASAPLHIAGRPWPSAVDAPVVGRHYVAPAHFRTLGIPIERGRGLLDEDRAGARRVVVINRAAAERFWPGEDPIGRRVWFDGAAAFGSPDSSAEIVGIVGDVAYQPLDDVPVRPDFYTAYAQFSYATRMLLVRTRAEPLGLVPEIARAVRRADPDLALFDVQTMAQRARTSWSKHGAQAAVFVLIGLIALALAATGVYAVASFFVTSRVRDIGVRMALGAAPRDVVRASVAQTAALGAVGGGAGIAGALALSRVLRATLYQTSALDVRIYVATLAILALALIAAAWLPVRRALRIDPAAIMRIE